MAKQNQNYGAADEARRTSKYDQNRTAFIDPETGDYVFNEWINTGTKKKPNWVLHEVARVPAKFKGWVRLLDEDDAAEDLGNRYENENRDFTTENAKKRRQEQEEGIDLENAEHAPITNPIENIADDKNTPENILFPEDEPTDPRIEQIEQTKVTKLTEEQRNLFYDHVGQQMYLEDIRKEKISVTGKNITQQAVSKQWRKTMKIFCDDLGVEMPKTRGKRQKKD